MIDPSIIQAGGIVVSLFVVLNALLEYIRDLIRDFRGGSPELKLIQEQLVNANKQHIDILKKILSKL